MSGQPDVRESITALARLGYVGTSRTFNAHSERLSLTWLTVTGGDSFRTAGAIWSAVHRIDPRAIRI